MIETSPVTLTAIYSISVPSIVAICQMVKGMVAPRWHRFVPLLAVALGLVVSIGAAQAVPFPPQPWISTGLAGLGIGLAASGLFSGARALARPE